MILLAIEQSTDTPSVAVLNSRDVLAEECWTNSRVQNQLFDVVPRVLRGVGMNFDAVGAYIVGLGPGSYTGLRMSLAAAMAFALPDHRLVYGLNSARALAQSVMEEYSCDSVIVIGDARRGHLWMRRFQKEDERRAAEAGVRDWRLVKPEELWACCTPSSTCVTADWDRIGARLDASMPESVVMIRGRRAPNAASLGKLAAVRMDKGIPSEPLSPIYLHPAVAGK